MRRRTALHVTGVSYTVCGIAGFSLAPGSQIDPEFAARVLLASVSERGADAAGYAYLDTPDTVAVRKQPGGASILLDTLRLPVGSRLALLHVRDHTKGRPSLPGNNHPIRHGRIVGIHNGRITNDEQIFAQLGRARAERGMTVDSEAIFALLDADPNPVTALERLQGPLACAWLDESLPGILHLAKGHGRPLWVALTRDGDATSFLFASTLEALEITEEMLGISLRIRPVRPGTILSVHGGAIRGRLSFTPDARAEWLAHPVASPAERLACMAQLATG